MKLLKYSVLLLSFGLSACSSSETTQADESTSWWSFAGKPAAKQAAEPNQQARLEQYGQQLNRELAGSLLRLERRGNTLVLVIPVEGSFNTKRPELLLPAALSPLGRVAKLLQQDPRNAVLVLGHSDSSGDRANNERISLQRAQAVSSIFRLSGMGSDRLRLKGLGASQPLADNASAKGRAQNRRVEVLLTQSSELLALAQKN